MPVKLAFGVYTGLPVTASIVTVPLAPCVTAVTVRPSPSTSVSLPRTGMVTAVSSAVLMLSSIASGASFTGTTSIVVPPLTVVTPSDTVYAKLPTGSVPL